MDCADWKLLYADLPRKTERRSLRGMIQMVELFGSMSLVTTVADAVIYLFIYLFIHSFIHYFICLFVCLFILFIYFI